MINKIGSYLMSIVAKKYIAGWIGSIYGKLTGYKTQISLVLMVIVYALQVKGIIPEGLADQIYPMLQVAGTMAFLQKIKRYVKMFEDFSAEVK